MDSFSVKAASFQIGHTFYYWDYYQSTEYYIKRKYDTFKDELREYKHLSIRHYQNYLTPKVTQYMNTMRAKKTKASKSKAGIDEFKYEIQPESKITFNHLLSVCLYTDFTDLCTEFSKTFRPLNNYETLDSVKERNRDYFFMSKYLRESVELFGDYHSIWSNNKLIGPFYSGLSFVALFPITDITLNSPTSTTYYKEVAIKFSGDGNGVIVEFDNINNKQLHGFDCGWISQFKEESEVLFMGGAHKIHINGVTVMDTKIKHQIYFRALTKFDLMLKGKSSQWNESEKCMICDLIDCIVNNTKNSDIDNYIYDSFALFLNNKLKIYLNVKELQRIGDPKIANKIIYTHSTKLFRSNVILKLFKNLQLVVIAYDSKYKFPFEHLQSMMSESYSIETVAIRDEFYINNLHFNKDELIDMFQQHQLNIHFENIGRNGEMIAAIMISRNPIVNAEHVLSLHLVI